MAYEGGMGYQLHMPSYFWRTFTEYPYIRVRGLVSVLLYCQSTVLVYIIIVRRDF